MTPNDVKNLKDAIWPFIFQGCGQVVEEHHELSPVEIEVTVGHWRDIALALRPFEGKHKIADDLYFIINRGNNQITNKSYDNEIINFNMSAGTWRKLCADLQNLNTSEVSNV